MIYSYILHTISFVKVLHQTNRSFDGSSCASWELATMLFIIQIKSSQIINDDNYQLFCLYLFCYNKEGLDKLGKI
jgi:hypothetical protein